MIEAEKSLDMSISAAEYMLLQLIESNLSLYLMKNARFYAERLYNLKANETNLHLLAKCYYHDMKIKQVYLLLLGSNNPANRYLFALACMDLGKLEEGERALLSSSMKSKLFAQSLSAEDIRSIPGGAAGLYLLGKIARKQHRVELAIEYFKASIELDSMMWSSLQELCELGVDVTPYLQLDPTTATAFLTQTISANSSSSNMNIIAANDATKAILSKTSNKSRLLAENMSRFSAQGGGSPHTATALGLSSSSFHVPFASPGSIYQHNTVDSMHEIDTLNASQLGVINPNLTRTSQVTSTLPRQANADSYLLTSTGDHHLNRLHSNKLFSMTSPALTPIQLQSHSFLQETSPIASYANPMRRPERESIGSTDPSGMKHGVNRNLGFMDSINSTTAAITPMQHSITPMAATPSTQDTINTMPTISKILTSPPPQTHGKKVNFGPTARLSFSNMGVASDVHVAGGLHHDLNFEDVADFDEHPPKLLRTAPNQHHHHLTSSDMDHDDVVDDNMHVDAMQLGTGIIASIVSVFGSAICRLMAFQCEETIHLLHSLPPNLFACGLTHQLIGKAFFESNDYKMSVLAYREMLRLEPFRTQGLEYLSSALWHLRKDKELSALAQQVAELDKLSPETWCVLGNCFSLQHEPDIAMRFFQRAIQLDESYPYAHTLLGHEYVHNEDFDRAIQSFRCAILHDQRHYNAWYGLGAIYYRQERFELAEYHFRRAISINHSSSVLTCYLAMVLHAQNKGEKTMEALEVLQQAIQRDEKNPQLHFQRAHVLFSIDEVEEVIEELEIVRKLAPREPPVYSMLGRAHQRLGHVDEAMKHFLYAMDLDPKEGAGLKAELEAIGEPVLDGILDAFL